MPVKILAIDDEQGVLEMIREHFELRGFQVFTASDGEAGILLCREALPDIILLDLKMKNLDGDRALPEIRQIVPKAKIFVISAYQNETVEKRLAGLGADGCFEKPVSILDLERLVRSVL